MANAIIDSAKAAWAAWLKLIQWKRTAVANEEIQHGKDLDGDGIIGGVGNRKPDRDKLRDR